LESDLTLLTRERLGKIKSLDPVAAETSELDQLCFGLDTLGGDGHLERLPDGEDR
jgi:hypothetical protein